MVLAGYLNFVGLQIFHGMIGTMVSKLQLVSSATEGKCQNLMTKTDAEDWDLIQKLPDSLNRITYSRRVTGTIA